MLIDFHVHVFPDDLAERAVTGIIKESRDIYGIERTLSFDATVNTLKEDMIRNNVDMSIVLPIATKPKQHKTINRFARDITNDKIISFASLHPYDEDVSGILKEIKSAGFKGIKLHPDYQNVFVDDEHMIRLVREAAELGLYSLFHSGEDLGIKAPFHCTLDRLRAFLNSVDENYVILAHMGGFNIWDGVEKYIVNSPAYFDTAIVSRFLDIDSYRRIVDKHGADKILFGSDAPWEDPKDTLAFLERAGFSEEEKELIKHKNAERILKLK